jgi:RND family efflux transporter MFP subunit
MHKKTIFLILKNFYKIFLLTLLCSNLTKISLADLSQDIPVKTTNVQDMTFYEKYTATAKCQQNNSKSYYAKSNGVVDYVIPMQGQEVPKNDILIKINTEIADAIKSKAQAALDSAKSTYLRDLSLLNKKIISAEAVEKSRVLLENAKSDLAESLDKYDNMIIKAPFTGYIGVIHAKPEDNIKTGDYLFTIATNGNKILFAELPENLNNKINNKSEIFLVDNSSNKITGKIEAISNYLNNNGTITIKLVFPTATDIINGSFVEANIIYNRHQGLGVPEKTILKNSQGNFVYKLTQDNKVKQVYVKTGTRLGNFIEIFSEELIRGDSIILEGLTKIYEGATVKLIDDNPKDDNQHGIEE